MATARYEPRAMRPLPGVLFALVLLSCGTRQTPTEPAAMTSGYVVYTVTHRLNPEHRDDGHHPFSTRLQGEILASNVPGTVRVWVDGSRSRTESVTNDYEIVGRTIVLRFAGEGGKETYCKELSHLNWCTSYTPPVPASPGKDVPATFETRDGIEQIAGHSCREGVLVDGTGSYRIYYAPSVNLVDRTGALEQHPEVPGLIMEKEPLPAPGLGRYIQKIAVSEVALRPVDAGLLEAPAGFEEYGADAARAENRRRWLAEARAELAAAPLTADERSALTGPWLLDNGEDVLLAEVVPTGADNEVIFRITNFTSQQPDLDRVEEGPGTLWRRRIAVEEPPNYLVYELSSDGRTLTCKSRPAFTYQRISPERARAIADEHGRSRDRGAP